MLTEATTGVVTVAVLPVEVAVAVVVQPVGVITTLITSLFTNPVVVYVEAVAPLMFVPFFCHW